MSRDQYLPETIETAEQMTERRIAEYVAAGWPLARAQMDATQDTAEWLRFWRELGAEI